MRLVQIASVSTCRTDLRFVQTVSMSTCRMYLRFVRKRRWGGRFYALHVEAAFFDLDKTVIAKAAMAAFRRPFHQEGMISRHTVLRIVWSNLIFMQLGADEKKLARVRTNILRLTRGWHQERVRELVHETFEEIVTPIIYEEALDLINYHRDLGRFIVVVSASPEEIVEPLSEYLHADMSIASRARVDDEGRYTGEMEFLAQGPAKATAIEHLAYTNNIDLQNSYAYSDSITDLPMLNAVGHPVVVNPDRALARIAKERNWEVRKFAHPIPLRERPGVVRMTRPSSISALAGMAAAGVTVVVISRVMRKRKG